MPDRALLDDADGRTRPLRRRCVWAIVQRGFIEEPDAATLLLTNPWLHVFNWLHKDEPTPAELKALLFHLSALAHDRHFVRPEGSPFGRDEFAALAKQIADYLVAQLLDRLTHTRAVEALLHRDYERGLSNLFQARDVVKFTALLAMVEHHLPWPEAAATPDLVVAVERLWAQVSDAEFAVSPDVAAALLAKVLAMLGSMWSGARAAVVVPLAGEHPGVVRFMVSCAVRESNFGADDASTGSAVSPPPRRKVGRITQSFNRDDARRPITWHGLPVAPDVLNRLDDVIGTLSRLIPSHAAAVGHVHVFISESQHRPLDRAVKQLTGRSWELGALVALASALTGAPLEFVGATGQIHGESGRVEPIGGVEEKIEALFACRPPDDTPFIKRLLCPHQNVGAAERAAKRLGWKLDVRGVSTVEEVLGLIGPDPWAAYGEALERQAEAARSRLGVSTEWLAQWLPSTVMSERVVALPCPFAEDWQAWALQLAAEWVRERKQRLMRRAAGSNEPNWGGVPVILPPDSDAPRLTTMIVQAVQALADVSETVVFNMFQMPDGFVFIHADPKGTSPILEPTSRVDVLAPKHAAMRHRFCFLATDLHQLEAWRAHPILKEL